MLQGDLAVGGGLVVPDAEVLGERLVDLAGRRARRTSCWCRR